MNAIAKAVPASRRLPFHVPHRSSRQAAYVGQVLSSGSLCPGGAFSRKAEAWLEQHTGAERAILTHSCTGAMEIAALALGLGPGDEVIVPTFTFCATATAFERAGARIGDWDRICSQMTYFMPALCRFLWSRSRTATEDIRRFQLCQHETAWAPRRSTARSRRRRRRRRPAQGGVDVPLRSHGNLSMNRALMPPVLSIASR